MLPRELLCAFRLFCVCLLGTRGAAAQEVGAQPELFIFNELCALKEDPGPCRALRDKYFFNVDTGRCELFEYGGCGGNANNFETLEACRETCLVSEDKNPCHLPEAEGPCRGLVTRYFFNSSSQQCKRFYYGGCFGNANNFRSMAECQAKCGQQESVQVQTGAGEIVDVPSTALTGQQTVNMAVTQTSNADPDHSQDAKLSDVCSAPVERGTCDGSLRRFAYHPKAKRCHEFLYSGCGGNNNNFKHRRQCIRKCMKSQKDRGMKMIRIRKKNIPSILHGSV
ncbi:tissue factor pathway inhibitor a isoform X1 [Hippocampus comes]|uniref:Tissue factor pathway inhibitor n=1 Tax=Hippocampus comes TaxID=109280 RepID=A0A3Q3DJJ7_HIPCM|nr:PREDICTED: kunitz-type serine protease inhibitor bitisilin-3-like isoform X1 [Hippocampus comes]XP_019724803.1 PREDICTED: kunitz-type serine protease inhibitor bitisilin-3-like isoform X1 [Hippocampus comes]